MQAAYLSHTPEILILRLHNHILTLHDQQNVKATWYFLYGFHDRSFLKIGLILFSILMRIIYCVTFI